MAESSMTQDGDLSGDPALLSRGSRSQLSEEVASYVRELILSGRVKPGEFIRLEPIAEAL